MNTNVRIFILKYHDKVIDVYSYKGDSSYWIFLFKCEVFHIYLGGPDLSCRPVLVQQRTVSPRHLVWMCQYSGCLHRLPNIIILSVARTCVQFPRLVREWGTDGVHYDSICSIRLRLNNNNTSFSVHNALNVKC